MKVKNWENIVSIKMIYYLIVCILILSGATFAYWIWESNSNQWSDVAFEVPCTDPDGDCDEPPFQCSANGGEPLTSEGIY